jgi:hypothetical protein
MENFPYLDKPFVPLAVASWSMLAETEAKIPTAAPAEKPRLQERAEVLRECITPKSGNPALGLAAYGARLAYPPWPLADL